MSNRFPPLAAPLPSILPSRTGMIATLPLWTRSLPLGEILVLGCLGLLLIVA